MPQIPDCAGLTPPGLRGAHFSKRMGRFTSSIQRGGRLCHLGCFETAEQAHAAYMKEARRLHGEFVREAS